MSISGTATIAVINDATNQVNNQVKCARLHQVRTRCAAFPHTTTASNQQQRTAPEIKITFSASQYESVSVRAFSDGHALGVVVNPGRCGGLIVGHVFAA